MQLQLLYVTGLLVVLGVAYATESKIDVNRMHVSKANGHVAVPVRAKLRRTVTKEWRSYTIVEHWAFEHIPLPMSASDGANKLKVPLFTPITSMIKSQFITSTSIHNPSFSEHISKGVVYSIPFHIPVTARRLSVKDALGWITNFARNEGVLTVQPRYPLANGWKSEMVIKYVVSNVKEASGEKAPFDGMDVEVELIDGGDATNYRSLLVPPLLMSLGYLTLKSMGKRVPFNQERNKLLLAVKHKSDLEALREYKSSRVDVIQQGLYEKQVDMLEMLLQCSDMERRTELAAELVSLDDKILAMECNQQ